MVLEHKCFTLLLHCSGCWGHCCMIENALYSLGMWESPQLPGCLSLRAPLLWGNVSGDGVPSPYNLSTAPCNQMQCCMPKVSQVLPLRSATMDGDGVAWERLLVGLWLPDLSCFTSVSPPLSLGLAAACICPLPTPTPGTICLSHSQGCSYSAL